MSYLKSRKIWLLCAMALATLIAIPIFASVANSGRVISIFSVDGSVTHTRADGRSSAARTGTRLAAGDNLSTGRASAVQLQIDRHSVVQMGANSDLTVRSTSNNLSLSLNSGNALVDAAPQGAGNTLETRVANVAMAVRGTMFTLGHTNRYGQIVMLSGSGEVNGVPLEAGYMLQVHENASIALADIAPIVVTALDNFTLGAIWDNHTYLLAQGTFELAEISTVHREMRGRNIAPRDSRITAPDGVVYDAGSMNVVDRPGYEYVGGGYDGGYDGGGYDGGGGDYIGGGGGGGGVDLPEPTSFNCGYFTFWVGANNGVRFTTPNAEPWACYSCAVCLSVRHSNATDDRLGCWRDNWTVFCGVCFQCLVHSIRVPDNPDIWQSITPPPNWYIRGDENMPWSSCDRWIQGDMDLVPCYSCAHCRFNFHNEDCDPTGSGTGICHNCVWCWYRGEWHWNDWDQFAAVLPIDYDYDEDYDTDVSDDDIKDNTKPVPAPENTPEHDEVDTTEPETEVEVEDEPITPPADDEEKPGDPDKDSKDDGGDKGSKDDNDKGNKNDDDDDDDDEDYD